MHLQTEQFSFTKTSTWTWVLKLKALRVYVLIQPPGVCFFQTWTRGKKIAQSLLSTAKFLTEYSSDNLLCENISKGFLTFCKVILNMHTRSDHCLKSYKRAQTCRISCARLHEFIYEKQISNTIITQAYLSRCSSRNLSSKARIPWDF